MSLESLLSPFKWTDEHILTQYTKIGKRFNLDKERRKYRIAMALNLNCFILTYTIKDIDQFHDISRFTLSFFDNMYNFHGFFGNIREYKEQDIKIFDPLTNFYKKYNSIFRLPIFLTGLGFIGKFGVDLYNNFTQGDTTDNNSYYYLQYGLGLLSLASSMYIKDIDPKLLNKKPLWKKAYDFAKEKLKVPDPRPQPVPIQAHIINKTI